MHRLIQVGLGPIGLDTARRAAARKNYSVVGGVDLSPDLQGRGMQELLGTGVDCEGEVLGSLEEAIERFRPDVALVTTVSDLDKVVPTAEALLEKGVAVISTCEEMAYPFISQPELSARLDEAGKRGGAACVGTGINPGFVLDFLPVALTGPLDRVDRVRAARVVDAGLRRGPLQKKVGAGLTPEEFQARVDAGGFGHRGFMESLHLVCAAFGVDTAGATTFIRPVISEKEVKTEHAHVKPGLVAGIHQGAEDREGKVILDLKMYVGAEDPGDRAEITGDPSIEVFVKGGYHGDVATAAISLNAVPAILSAAPGLRSMLDIRPVHGPLI